MSDLSDRDRVTPDLREPLEEQLADALRQWQEHVRSHGCGRRGSGGTMECPVARDLWYRMPDDQKPPVS